MSSMCYWSSEVKCSELAVSGDLRGYGRRVLVCFALAIARLCLRRRSSPCDEGRRRRGLSPAFDDASQCVFVVRAPSLAITLRSRRAQGWIAGRTAPGVCAPSVMDHPRRAHHCLCCQSRGSHTHSLGRRIRDASLGAPHLRWKAALGDAPRRRRLRGMGSTHAALVC